jgi:hypothetical protein
MTISVEDEHGCAFRRNFGNYRTMGKKKLNCAKLDAYPRRQKQFKMCFSRGTNIVSFMVHNPQIILPVEWKPSPLPVTAKVGDLKMTIVELKSSVSPDNGAYFVPAWEIYDKDITLACSLQQ